MNEVRGYIFSRPFMDERVPQHIQNQVIRNYCLQNQLEFLLSSTEYAMNNCHLMLDQVLDTLDKINGIVLYSLFQLPNSQAKRREIYKQFLKEGRVLHFAVEGLKAQFNDDFERIEVLWSVRLTLPKCPKSKDLIGLINLKII
jgi:sporadic carbohydrate cluster protein (TIGR04323 family)